MTKGKYVDVDIFRADSISEAKKNYSAIDSTLWDFFKGLTILHYDFFRHYLNYLKKRDFPFRRIPLAKWSSNCSDLLDTNERLSTTVEIGYRLQGLGSCLEITIGYPSLFSYDTTYHQFYKKSDIFGHCEIVWSTDRTNLDKSKDHSTRILVSENWMGQTSSSGIVTTMDSNSSINPLYLDGSISVLTLRLNFMDFRMPSNWQWRQWSRLVCSKTKVAPLKRLIVPRLKLTAALFLTRLMVHTLKALELPEASVFCWSDSSVTLTWITAHLIERISFTCLLYRNFYQMDHDVSYWGMRIQQIVPRLNAWSVDAAWSMVEKTKLLSASQSSWLTIECKLAPDAIKRTTRIRHGRCHSTTCIIGSCWTRILHSLDYYELQYAVDSSHVSDSGYHTFHHWNTLSRS